MAMNVFGIPVTDDIVRTYPQYTDKDVITRTDRATVAVIKKHDNNKDANALKYVENLKAAYGDGVTALCMVYNATGDTVTFVTSHDWNGHIGTSPYPQEIANGQWATFLHVHPTGQAVGAEAGVVYRGKNEAGANMDWMLSWSVPWGRWSSNRAYTMVREAGRFVEWKAIYDQLHDSSKEVSSHYNGCVSNVAIGEDTSPQFYGSITLSGTSE